jgi:SAM-dependent methyltransferase
MSVINLLLFILATGITLSGLSYLLIDFYLRFTQGNYFVPYVSADHFGIEQMLNTLNLKGVESIVDVGSGTGSIIFQAAKKFPTISLSGIEINPFVYAISQIKRIFSYKNKKIEFILGDATALDYRKFDVVFVFMLSTFLDEKLMPKLEKELKKGAIIASYVFRIKSTKFSEEEILLPTKSWRQKIYIYRKITD